MDSIMFDWILDGQKLLLFKNSPWFAFAFLGYSLVNSWHCSVMCGGLAFDDSKPTLHKILLWRLIGYSSVGALMGLSSQALLTAPEYQVVRALAFFVMCLFSLAFVFPWISSRLFNRLKTMGERPFVRKHPRLRGLLMAALPCHLLASSYGAAVLSGSPVVGAGILFGHAVMTTPSLAYSWSGLFKLSRRWGWARAALKAVLIGMIFLNLLFFGARIFLSDTEVENRFLFCF